MQKESIYVIYNENEWEIYQDLNSAKHHAKIKNWQVKKVDFSHRFLNKVWYSFSENKFSKKKIPNSIEIKL